MYIRTHEGLGRLPTPMNVVGEYILLGDVTPPSGPITE